MQTSVVAVGVLLQSPDFGVDGIRFGAGLIARGVGMGAGASSTTLSVATAATTGVGIALGVAFFVFERVLATTGVGIALGFACCNTGVGFASSMPEASFGGVNSGSGTGSTCSDAILIDSRTSLKGPVYGSSRLLNLSLNGPV